MVSIDFSKYIIDFVPVRAELRKTRDLNMGDEEWMKVIEMIERRAKK